MQLGLRKANDHPGEGQQYKSLLDIHCEEEWYGLKNPLVAPPPYTGTVSQLGRLDSA